MNQYTNPTARKPHKCEWCAEEIAVGTKHTRATGQYEGDWQDWRMHGECFDAFMRETDHDGGYIDPHVHERGKTSDEMRAAHR